MTQQDLLARADSVFRQAYAKCGSLSDAQDLAQETLLTGLAAPLPRYNCRQPGRLAVRRPEPQVV